ncbi:sigma-54-dependent Fis family transcriptional regulator [Neobacillus rhizophilus]|uniref:Sigma-54-dependent Fis family transcriptional regulator n=1 Tax=Neobacillus rhizophilus TaxID=2833579 RepID=A0A942U701_9BACI|nr:sigma-54-dependent Fis family transcriptional regulator [Neobacillus rhizophilus]MBS4214087.1 sigma-54-dependent Fis family transcriptional regulator [Neobacillus rhizophilus]
MDHTILLNRTWERFVKEDVLDSSRISKQILESWYRCKESNVDPYLVKGKTVLFGDEYFSKVSENETLLKIATPYIQSLWRSIKEKSRIIMLTDANGYVLKVIRDSIIDPICNQLNLIEGVKWTEKEVGTNAIGTALAIEEPIHVVGKEHYSLLSQNWTCSAAPIKNSRGELIGVLDISKNQPYYEFDIYSLTVSTAYAIESEWKLQEQRDRIALVELFLQFKQKDNEQMMISDINGYLVTASDSIMKIIRDGNNPHDFEVKNLKDFGIKILTKQPLYSGDHRLIGFKHFVKHVNENSNHYFSAVENFTFMGEQGNSIAFGKILCEMKKAAKSNVTVSIYGESGTGKEVVAKSIHVNSDRKDKPFVAVNCGAIPKELLESELFGYVEGAFTGARKKGYEGKFVQANRGTIFLDEIGEMPYSMQIALLRVLQEKEVVPIGSEKPIPVDVRIITATNKKLEELVRRGEFRQDLYYRIHVFDLKIPPLSERKQDIPELVKYFFKTKNINLTISSTIMDKLTAYSWPGNIRELFNVLEKMMILSEGKSLKLSHLPSYIKESNDNPSTPIDPRVESTKNLEGGFFSNNHKLQKEKMIKALQSTNGNIREAASLIGMPLSTFYRKMKKFNI